ncbi:ABC transporter substrate-binding protein [Candidatus Woesearchaeota archaeon]|nr:ABC transporter substrate-binding protein [Candidatus Woesearchaeota archaeon]
MNYKRINRILFSISLILMLTLIGCSQVEKQETIKIGAMLSLTGKFSDEGEASLKAIQMAIEEINKGTNNKEFSLIVEDTQCDSTKTVTAINKLISVDKVRVIIGESCSASTLAAAPIAEKNKVILINTGSTSGAIAGSGEYIFKFWFNGDELAQMNAVRAFEEGAKKVSIIYLNNDFGLGLKDKFEEEFENLGGEVVNNFAIEEGERNYRTVLLKAEEKKPDIYFIALFPQEMILTIKQMKELDINKQIYTHGGMIMNAQILGISENILDGVIGPFVSVPSEEFKQKFKAKYNEDPGITADSSYDAINIVSSVIRNVGTDTETIKNELLKIKNYKGASGTFSVNEEGGINKALSFYKVIDNNIVELD